MLEFNQERFLETLREKLPNANVTNRRYTDEEREAKREYLHRINQRWNHAPTLGYGALRQRGKA
jgi:hypothetical protein